VHGVRDRSGRWAPRFDSPYARRYTARSPALLTGPAAGLAEGGKVVGTMGNCSGGVTPWGTVLSCEEETRLYAIEENGYGWGKPYDKLRHYSWVVEIDPFDPEWVPLKRTALGRFLHENVAIRIARDGRLVAYMGDDQRNGFVYKYVSLEGFRLARGLANGDLLDRGQLYVAHCREDGSGSWTPLPMNEECLGGTHAYIVERGLPATPMDRPEDLEIHPQDGSVYIALTNNDQPAPGRVIPPLEVDPYGKIARFIEEGGNATARAFRWEVFAVGGPQAGFAAPDNLEFDRTGNLWIISDFAAEKSQYARFGNNGMFMVPTGGRHAGLAFQFASAPVDSELTGPWLSPDETSLFLSVQHPGARSRPPQELTSHWPGGSGIPRPSTVVIQRRSG
jgi:secreted PhoX family phosphatase